MKSFIRHIITSFAVLLFTVPVFAQDMLLQALIPPGALIEKEQLWNMIISNPTQSPRSCQISVTITSRLTGQKIFTAISGLVLVPPGARQLQVADVMPVMYNALTPEVSQSDIGFLPVGNYMVCYEMLGKGFSYGNSCVDTRVEALAPPQLIFPENKSMLTDSIVAFSWIPPAPALLMRNCTYEYKIVKLEDGQIASKGIMDNTPVYQVSGLTNTSLQYPAFAKALEKKQSYAWQITARTTTADIKSDVWAFSIDANDPRANLNVVNTAFTKLTMDAVSEKYSLVDEKLRFSFFNDSKDSLFQIQITDVTAPNHRVVTLNTDALPKFLPGLNLIELELSLAGKFAKQHMYELELTDKSNRSWKMMFLYSGKNNNKK